MSTPQGPRIAFYVSGHGFGHAVRAGAVVRTLTAIAPMCRILVRTRAPRHFFEAPDSDCVLVTESSVDPAIVESDPMHVDGSASLAAVGVFLERKQEVVRREVEFIRSNAVGLLVADIPFILGDIAAAAGLPCIALGNFTWDWIHEPYAKDVTGGRGLVRSIRESYARMTELLMLPFSDQASMRRLFPAVREVPLVARKSTRAPADTRALLGLAEEDLRSLILVSSRGELPAGTLRAAAANLPDYAIVVTDPSCGRLAPNVWAPRLGIDCEYIDLVGAADVVISKLGYSGVADCLANGARLLHPPRVGFREDTILERDLASQAGVRGLTAADYSGGHWREALEHLLQQPRPCVGAGVNGAQVCAEAILRHAAQG